MYRFKDALIALVTFQWTTIRGKGEADLKTMKSRKRKSSVVCFVAAILLIPAHQAIAQIRTGRITVTIPELSSVSTL